MVALHLWAAAPAAAQVAGWVVRVAPHVDLWFHGLATVGYQGPGPLAYYDSEYAAQARQAKQDQGLFPTRIDREAASLSDAFRRDSTFEFFHFLPLYFISADQRSMFEALRAVASGYAAMPDMADQRTRFGARATASVMDRPAQRALLARYLDALAEEWRIFYRRHWEEVNVRNGSRYAHLQETWNRDFAPHLRDYLSQVRLDGGVIVVSPPLGPEGRIFEGDPNNRLDNLVAVRLPAADNSRNLPLYSAVRELCYPTLRKVLQRVAGPGRDRLSAEMESSRAAVRCGALLLERNAPDLLAGYLRAFLSPDGDVRDSPALSDVEALKTELRRVYPIDDELEADLANEFGLPPES